MENQGKEGKPVPVGVMVLSMMAFAAGVWRLLMACFALWASLRLIFVRGSAFGISAGFDLTCLGLLGLVLAVACLAVADALFNLKRWAWNVGVILGVLNILFALMEMFVSVIDSHPARGHFPWPTVVALTLNGLMLWYLMRSDVRGLFNSNLREFVEQFRPSEAKTAPVAAPAEASDTDKADAS